MRLQGTAPHPQGDVRENPLLAQLVQVRQDVAGVPCELPHEASVARSGHCACGTETSKEGG